MKKKIPVICLILGMLYLLAALRPATNQSGWLVQAFGQVPVLQGGRMKPLDSVARNHLLMIRGKQTCPAPQGRLSASRWLLDVCFRPEVADTYPIFRIDNPDVLGILHEKAGEQQYYTFNRLVEAGLEIERQASFASSVESARRTPFQRDIINLHQKLVRYHQLKNSLLLEGMEDPSEELQIYRQIMPKGFEALEAHQKGGAIEDHDSFHGLLDFVSRFRKLDQLALFKGVPGTSNPEDATVWMTTGEGLLRVLKKESLHPALPLFMEMGSAYRRDEQLRFNTAVADWLGWLEQNAASIYTKARYEFLLNHIAPFYRAMTLYVAAFIICVLGWLFWPVPMSRGSSVLIGMAFAVHTLGLVGRMLLEGRPPVTNLYSSAVFIGWFAVGLGLILERLYKNGMGNVVSSLIGFATLIIAHHLSLSGDTLEMMRAVLDSNFWLATHVVTITIGYSGTFLAGFLAAVTVLRGVLTRSLTKEARTNMAKMVFGVICFSTFFSFVGTILGGIWADQSWGRFWGWDPKENGALLIVLWNIIILHARLDGLIRARGLMVMALFGNIVTAWSWFGTNMLGVGLHSYGFMDAAFYGLLGFFISQLVIMGLGSLPLRLWRSSRPV